MSDIVASLQATKEASRRLVDLTDDQINDVLYALADRMVEKSEDILSANQKDLKSMNSDDPKYDRLLLNESRIKEIAKNIKGVASLPSPLNLILEKRDLPSGLHLQKISVPLGVIGIIYEARPNVTFDAFALTFKSGNAVVLKGGSDAKESNFAEVEIIKEVLKEHGLNSDLINLLPPDRSAVAEILTTHGLIDIIIPRGSQNLINFVRENSKIPVIETGAGVCHTYIDSSADINKAAAIVFNAKTKRPGVCNALDCLVIHRDRLKDLPDICDHLKTKDVEIYADEGSYRYLKGFYPDRLLKKAQDDHFGREWLSLRMSVKTVNDFNEALDHIARYSSRHSEAIVAEDKDVIEKYLKRVDAGAVYSNASTYFTDGAQFGLGAEIGISTQKLHARGPMGLKEMTSYKWVLRGSGQIRE